MRNRHNHRAASSAAGMAGIITRNPREAVALFAASAALTIIFVNALFLQAGPHPAPIFAHQSTPVGVPAAVVAPSLQPVSNAPAPLPRPETIVRKVSAKPAAAVEPAHSDPIAQLLAPSNRVLAVQRALTEFGYGQIRPTGVVGPDTQEAIRKFQRSRKMPVTGAMSDQLVHALAEMSGRAVE